jgi:signal transduction histidine kinase
LTALLAPESGPPALEYFAGLRSQGAVSLFNQGREVIVLTRQGGALPVFITIAQIGTAGSVTPGEARYCALLRDLTNWKNVEQELEAARREAERANALKSAFLAKVSHEIRTPLNAILGFAEVMIEERFGPIGNPRYKDYIGHIHASGALVMSLVNDLLDLGKIEAGKMDFSFASIDVNRIVSECVSIMQPQARSEQVDTKLSLSPALPNILADERALRQIVLNLLSNAVKFNRPGGQVIVTTLLADSGSVIVRIRDTGLGMRESDISLAFEPFHRLNTGRSSRGTGLGLPLTKALIEANGASLTFKSKEQEGTLVEVVFPPARILAE